MSENGYVSEAVFESRDALEYDLADAIYAACLVDIQRSDSAFYFMDPEDGGTAMLAWVA